MKMTGDGLKLGLQNVQVVMGDEICIQYKGEMQSCILKEYEVVGYKMSVCGEEEKFGNILEWIEV